MNLVGWLPSWDYREVARMLPVLCVDAILGNSGRGPCKFLLVRRRLAPFAGDWWVPGGRVFKGETLVQAFRRIVSAEVGVRIRGTPRLVGIYELRYNGEDVDVPCGRHTVSVVLGVMIPARARIRLDHQSTEWKWAERLPKKFRVVEV